MTPSRCLLVSALVIGAAILVPRELPAQSKPLPDETRSLLDNLEQWEFQEKVHLEEKLKEKRKQVIEALRRQQASYTRQGDLDTALAIKKRADELEALVPNPPAGMLFEMPWDDGDGRVRVLFHRDGTATYTNLATGKVFDRTFRWAEKSPGVIDLWYHTRKQGEGMRWNFDNAFRSAKVELERENQKMEAERVEARAPASGQ